MKQVTLALEYSAVKEDFCHRLCGDTSLHTIKVTRGN
jgi:hypothetical protein